MKLERATAKQMSQLRRVIDVVLTRDLDPVTFANTVIANWTYFAREVGWKTEDVQYIPDNPNLGFTTYFLGYLISIVQEEVARKVKVTHHARERQNQHEKENAEREMAHLTRQYAHQAEMNDLAKRGADFPTKEAAVGAMYRCLGRGEAVQSIQGWAIRAFLSSWGGDDQLDDVAICAEYRSDLAIAFFSYSEDIGGEEEQPVPCGVVPFSNGA